jgi:hypothetical protein
MQASTGDYELRRGLEESLGVVETRFDAQSRSRILTADVVGFVRSERIH